MDAEIHTDLPKELPRENDDDEKKLKEENIRSLQTGAEEWEKELPEIRKKIADLPKIRDINDADAFRKNERAISDNLRDIGNFSFAGAGFAKNPLWMEVEPDTEKRVGKMTRIGKTAAEIKGLHDDYEKEWAVKTIDLLPKIEKDTGKYAEEFNEELGKDLSKMKTSDAVKKHLEKVKELYEKASLLMMATGQLETYMQYKPGVIGAEQNQFIIGLREAATKPQQERIQAQGDHGREAWKRIDVLEKEEKERAKNLA